MKQSNSKIYGCLIGGAVLGTFSLLYACGDDSAPAEAVDAGTVDAAPAPKDSAPADAQEVKDSAPPPPDLTVNCTDGAIFCDNFDQPARTVIVSNDGGWVVYDGDIEDFSFSTTVFSSPPRSLQVARPKHSGVALQKTFSNLTKPSLTIDIDYRLDTSGTTVPVIPPVLVDVLPHPDDKGTNSLLINHRDTDGEAKAFFEYDDGVNQAVGKAEIVSPLNAWNHAKLVLSTGGDGGTVTGTVSINGATPVALSLPTQTMTTVILRVGQIYAVDPPNRATVLIDNVVVNEQ